MHLKAITNISTHHIQECLRKGKWLRCIMDLSLGTPGHCPGFILKLSGLISPPVNLSPFELPTSYLYASTGPSTTRSVPYCSRLLDSPIQTSLPVKIPFLTSNLTHLDLVHHWKKVWLTSNRAILKIKLHSTIKSNEFQKTNKNPNKGDSKKKKEWSGSRLKPNVSLSKRVSAVQAHRRPPSRTSSTLRSLLFFPWDSSGKGLEITVPHPHGELVQGLIPPENIPFPDSQRRRLERQR